MWQQLLHRYLRLPYRLNSYEFRSPAQPSVTIVLLHGIGSSLGMWQPLIAKLPRSARVIGIDLLGFGASPKPAWNVYGARTQADSIARTLFSLNISEPIILVGHSLGSLVAIEFAHRHYPFTIKSLVLISPPLYKPDRHPKQFDPKPEEVLRRMYALMAENPDATEKVLRLAGKYYLVNKGFRADTVNVPAYLASLEAAIINQQSYQDILKIKQPIHIVSGQFDAIVLDETIRDITRQQPNVEWTRALGGHEIAGAVRVATIASISKAAKDTLTPDN
ncbi:MAG TPA: alpha/beta hydrolase [Candidatus Saccharimonas sp.]|jgi:pimeloyl-ACP methyl ester carboxylesterase|nr:alpha/beta hydrolase [Candidatus Saccharimonas sp.]